MKPWNRTRRLVLAAALALASAAGIASTPFKFDKPVTVIVPYGTGGGGDLLARYLAEKLRQRIGVPVLVVNRVGAAGNIGISAVAKAHPDGYTIGFVANALVNNQFTSKIDYEPLTDLAPIAQVVEWGSTLVVPASNPARTVKEYLDQSRAAAAAGRPLHVGVAVTTLSYSLLETEGKTKFSWITYAAENEIMRALLAGDVTSMFAIAQLAKAQIAAGKVRALGYSALKPSKVMPGVPAISETIPGFESTFWFGYVAPAKTPQEVIETLQTEILAIVRQPDVEAELLEKGFAVQARTAAEFGEFLRSETNRLGPIFKAVSAPQR